jgi:hypothetical protein
MAPFLEGVGCFHFYKACTPRMGSLQPPLRHIPAAISLGIMRPDREPNDWTPRSAKNMNEWCCTLTLPNASKRCKEYPWNCIVLCAIDLYTTIFIIRDDYFQLKSKHVAQYFLITAKYSCGWQSLLVSLRFTYKNDNNIETDLGKHVL